ncbi:hypothetical protein CH373_02755 [Leptospira perolatii]|uniref:Lipocalin-like domain-containing protein n=1 Tax=Leptospira perolatii TaxID=2023191 RepID=A0A2M9ZSL9_9LEPT|nr:hypothetical protein [Leptospira perolatii]PJZ71435.1 hypothetical protein CH360_02755 [Leptospira perolatii]PJZ74969.1 hypothetical protein CH373_02755 [Leptospira perolatii]
MDRSDFLGTWIMDPKGTKYEFGPIPMGGEYSVQAEDNAYIVSMQYLDEDQQSQEIVYHLVEGENNFNGLRVILEFKAPDRMVTDIFSEEGKLLSSSIREIESLDGRKSLRVTQSGFKSDGSGYNNVLIFRKQI